MLKIILNEDFSHALMSDNFSQSTVFEISNYSTHSTNMNFNITAASIPNLLVFENTPITKLRIMEEEGEVITNLNFNTRNIFILSYNTSIYNGGQNTNVSIGQVALPEQNNEEEAEEGEGE